MLKLKDCRLKHTIKGDYAIIYINTNHWAIVKYVQEAYDIVANKIKEFDLIRKLKLNFWE